ncbi:hypothetical protein ISCGN_023985 [Ixodes scapularis]
MIEALTEKMWSLAQAHHGAVPDPDSAELSTLDFDTIIADPMMSVQGNCGGHLVDSGSFRVDSSPALPRNPHGSPQFQQLQLMRHEMQQFVQLLQGYVGGQVMQTSLAELQDDLDRQVRNVDDLRNTHLLFLKRLSQRLLLARRATPVAKLLREALRTVLLFQAELSAQSWLVEGGELRHPAFRRFQHAHTKFRQTVNLLLTTLTSWEELQCRQSCFKLSSVLGSTAFLWPDAAVHGQDVGGSPSEAQTAPSDCSGVSSIACNLSF